MTVSEFLIYCAGILLIVCTIAGVAEYLDYRANEQEWRDEWLRQ